MRALVNWGHALCMRARLVAPRDTDAAVRLYEAAAEKFTAAAEAGSVPSAFGTFTVVMSNLFNLSPFPWYSCIPVFLCS